MFCVCAAMPGGPRPACRRLAALPRDGAGKAHRYFSFIVVVYMNTDAKNVTTPTDVFTTYRGGGRSGAEM